MSKATTAKKKAAKKKAANASAHQAPAVEQVEEIAPAEKTTIEHITIWNTPKATISGYVKNGYWIVLELEPKLRTKKRIATEFLSLLENPKDGAEVVELDGRVLLYLEMQNGKPSMTPEVFFTPRGVSEEVIEEDYEEEAYDNQSAWITFESIESVKTLYGLKQPTNIGGDVWYKDMTDEYARTLAEKAGFSLAPID